MYKMFVTDDLYGGLYQGTDKERRAIGQARGAGPKYVTSIKNYGMPTCTYNARTMYLLFYFKYKSKLNLPLQQFIPDQIK